MGRLIDREGRKVGFVRHDPPFRPDRVEHDRGRDREREYEDDVPVGDRREQCREEDQGGNHTPGRSERRRALLPTRPMRDVAARRDRRADEVPVMEGGSRCELARRLVTRGTPAEVGDKGLPAVPARSRSGHVASSVGVSATEMKVPRASFGDDKTAFTTLLRFLGPLGDALGHMTYDDFGASPHRREGDQ